MSEGTTTEKAKHEGCTKDELMELVRAIKFAKPDASQRAVHEEITQVLSQTEPCLSDIHLNDVKKVWKKAVTAASTASEASGADVIKLFTVGDGTVSTLANQYSREAAKKALENRGLDPRTIQCGPIDEFVHVYLDVPADRSGSRPHQAVINFKENNDSGDAEENDAGGSERGEIVKIQVASAPYGERLPMLLYNSDRTAKTFIHPENGDDGYNRIFNLIVKEGVGGALGVSGGTKAYFYCRRTKLSTSSPDIMSIDIRSLAPNQRW